MIENSVTNWEGMQDWDSITDGMCDEQKIVFDDPNDHKEKGGLKAMGDSMERGHVLVLSLWDDHDVNMLWLDSDYPLDRDPSEPGVSRGSCSRDSGDPVDVEQNHPDATVHFSKIRVIIQTFRIRLSKPLYSRLDLMAAPSLVVSPCQQQLGNPQQQLRAQEETVPGDHLTPASPCVPLSPATSSRTA